MWSFPQENLFLSPPIFLICHIRMLEEVWVDEIIHLLGRIVAWMAKTVPEKLGHEPYENLLE